MKVCFLTGEYPPMQGGVADHTAHLAQQLVGLGATVSILTSHKAAINFQPMNFNPQVYPIVKGWHLGCWWQIQGWLKEHRPSVLHIQYQAAAYDLTGWVNWLPWWLRRYRTRPRLVVTFHDLRVPYLFPKAGPLRWGSILALARYSDAVIVTNEEDKKTLIPRLLDADSLTLIPLGSNVELQLPSDYERDHWRARIGADDHTLLLAYFGFLNQSKGGEDLVLALERLARRGYDAHLLMIGGQLGDVDPTNRAYAEQVRSLIQERGLAERVHWTGYTSPDEVSANLLAADVVVMPYRDGVSFRRTTFIAALCHGRPVVTTRPSVPLAELRDGDNVLLAAPCDVDLLARAIIRLADDADLRTHLSEGARVLGQQFSWDKIARQTADVYRRVPGGQSDRE
jgi:glycosyltransferase involved in cell wall biosynthesis